MKVKINKIGETWWYYPTILTLSRKFWHPRAYKNLKKLLTTENFLNQNFTISLNGDKNFEVFRSIQNLKGRKIFLKQKEIDLIENKKEVFEQVLKGKVKIFYDKKSVKSIKKGFIPFYDDLYIQKNFGKFKQIVWRKNGFEEKNAK